MQPLEIGRVYSIALASEKIQGELILRTQLIVDSFLKNKKYLDITTARPFLNIHTFLLLVRNPNSKNEDLIDHLNIYSDVLEAERKDSKNYNLPSIGLEVEVKKDDFFPYRIKPFDQLEQSLTGFGLKVKPEGTHKTEFEFPPTNNVMLQALLMNELIQVGIIPPTDHFAGMHINLGITENKINLENIIMANTSYSLIDFLYIMTSLLSYGWSTPGRIKRAEKQYYYAVRFHNSFPSVKSGKVQSIDEILELRSFRALNLSDLFHLLREAQSLGILVRNLSQKNIKILDNFLSKGSKLISDYKLRKYDIDYCGDTQIASNTLWNETQKRRRGEHINLIEEARSVIEETISNIYN